MDNLHLKNIRQALLRRLAEIDSENQNTTEDRAIVTLDQQIVGRLSRMDALQQQAMAKATHRRRQQEKTRLHAALKRLKEDGFGFCQDCGEDIPAARLNHDPTVVRCIECASG